MQLWLSRLLLSQHPEKRAYSHDHTTATIASRPIQRRDATAMLCKASSTGKYAIQSSTADVSIWFQSCSCGASKGITPETYSVEFIYFILANLDSPRSPRRPECPSAKNGAIYLRKPFIPRVSRARHKELVAGYSVCLLTCGLLAGEKFLVVECMVRRLNERICTTSIE